MRKINKKEGITLIALTISIVLVLILAGITTNLVIGQNRDINKYDICEICDRSKINRRAS